jgi:hypothetical protein
MPGGRRAEVFDRAGRLQTALYSIEHIGDNSTAAFSSQPRLFAGKIRADIGFVQGFQTLQDGFQMFPDLINGVEAPTGGKCATALCKIFRMPRQMLRADPELLAMTCRLANAAIPFWSAPNEPGLQP